ncbi:MAG: hypothetical protein KC613_10125 [Myxococcales bacterium]|nr:hypothetical protein [Myxococcales bacterium]MCB9523471.1 hypothetical protein [Myxococcales bacterium]
MLIDSSEDWSTPYVRSPFGAEPKPLDPDASAVEEPSVPTPLGTWTPSAIRRTARLLDEWTREGDPRAEILAASCQAEAARQGSMFARAAIVALVDVQPPALIEAIASTRARHLVGTLAKAVRFEQASDPVRIALANTVGELGGEAAIDLLEGWLIAKDLSPSVKHELRFALALARRRTERL